MSARRNIRTAVRITAAGGVMAGAVLLADMGASATNHHEGSKTSSQVVSEARNEYGLPATSADCWTTGPQLFSCWVSGKDGFKAVATGRIINGTARAVFS
jgi:hypothetical protein